MHGRCCEDVICDITGLKGFSHQAQRSQQECSPSTKGGSSNLENHTNEAQGSKEGVGITEGNASNLRVAKCFYTYPSLLCPTPHGVTQKKRAGRDSEESKNVDQWEESDKLEKVKIR